MNILLKSIHIIDPGSRFHKQTKDILIKNGRIEQIANRIPTKGHKVFDGNNGKIHVSAGWLDMCANFFDPGFEQREDIESGSKAAENGGFTAVALMPVSNPAVDSKTAVDYITSRSKTQLVDLLAVGSISEGLKAEQLTEMYDMNASGAIAFTNYGQPLNNAGLLLKALQYVKSFDGLIMDLSDERSISAGGEMNEGLMSAQMGMKGVPALAEEMAVIRTLKLLEYAESRVHFINVTTKESLDHIKKAKKSGLRVSCSTAAYHTALDDASFEDYDTNYKVFPPLRSTKQVNAICKSLEDGHIDAIISNHTPIEDEVKMLEFEHAEGGISSLETTFPVLNTYNKLKAERIVELLSTNPRKILGADLEPIAKGIEANLTIFDTSSKYTLEEQDLRSRSHNNPFIGTTLKGKVHAVINNNKIHLNQ